MPKSVATEPADTAPPARFNFAAPLLQCNAGRPDKAAFIDDRETLSYAGPERRVRPASEDRHRQDPALPPA